MWKVDDRRLGKDLAGSGGGRGGNSLEAVVKGWDGNWTELFIDRVGG